MTEQVYAAERSTTVCYTCNGDNSKLTWQGNVGLMYPSDQYMVYGNGVNEKCYITPASCYNNNAQTGWVYNSNIRDGQTRYEWTGLLSSLDGGTAVIVAYGQGPLLRDTSLFTRGVRPVIYLSSNIKIIGGTGEESNPYKLSL